MVSGNTFKKKIYVGCGTKWGCVSEVLNSQKMKKWKVGNVFLNNTSLSPMKDLQRGRDREKREDQ